MKKPSIFFSFVQQYSHALTWALLYITFLLASASHQTLSTAFLVANFTIIPMIVVWAATQHFLIPRYLTQHRMAYFILCLLLLLVVSTIATETELYVYTDLYTQGKFHLDERMENHIEHGANPNGGRVFIHVKYTFLLLSTLAISTVSWLLDERKRQSHLSRNTRTQLELKYLRAQMNPHFLFNSLNCIYSLTLMQDEKAPDSVLKLSEMLRYVTDDCRADEVSLQKEITYIRNYIDFYLIRLESAPDISFTVDVENPLHKIPPMIFQPMVENCFKHSRIVDHPDGYIHIWLTQRGNELTFTAENSKPADSNITEDKERVGIGLYNVEQRLDLLFADSYTFEAEEDKQKYRIELCIKY